jgi:hypothetical protein
MRRGIIMEVNDPYLTLLTPDGEFLRARKIDRPYFIGEEIDFFPVTDYIGSKKTNSFKNIFTLKTVWMSIAVVVICIGSIIPVYQMNKAYAYMSIDASTSIEMGLNKNMQVVELKGFNNEAKQIISQLDDWKKKDASELTTIILAELKEEGYIAQAKPVIISTVKTNQLKDKVATKLQENIEIIKQNVDKNHVEVNTYTTTEEELEKARNSGMPVGIYHKTKNESAQKNLKEKGKSTKFEKIKQKNSTPSGTSAESTLPPKQIKEHDENNGNPDINNKNKASFENYRGNENQNKKQVKQNEYNKINKQEKQNPNDQNKINKQEKQNNSDQNKWNKQEKQNNSDQNKWNNQQKHDTNNQNKSNNQEKNRNR